MVSETCNDSNVVWGVPFGRYFGRCPACKSLKVVPIIYGYPTVETVHQAYRGKLHHGGCYVTGHDPQYRCRHCGAQW